MKYIELKPIIDSPEDYDDIEKEIADFFKKEIYLPLIADFNGNPNVLKNSLEDIVGAIQSGSITFNRGKFEGKFSALISRSLKKIGAQWKGGAWHIALSYLPMELRQAISLSEYRFTRKLAVIDKRLADLNVDEAVKNLKLEDMFDTLVWKVDKKFQKNVKNIIVTPELSREERRRIAEEYTESLKLPIKKWIQEEILALRVKMKGKVFAGNRYDGAVKEIVKSYGVSRRKAKFLARQETLLLTGTLKQTRYEIAGINSYKWRCVIGSPKHPVRPRHKALNDMSQLHGKIFYFNDPPIVSEPGQPERRANAGMDYNCRCVSLPLIRFNK
jgi:SPP1 gp7 family putative phage head morphogenesis protein